MDHKTRLQWLNWTVDKVSSAWEWTKETASSLWDWFVEVIAKITEVAVDALSVALDWIVENYEYILGVLTLAGGILLCTVSLPVGLIVLGGALLSGGISYFMGNDLKTVFWDTFLGGIIGAFSAGIGGLVTSGVRAVAAGFLSRLSPFMQKYLPIALGSGAAGFTDSVTWDLLKDGKVNWKKAILSTVLGVGIVFGAGQFIEKAPTIISKINKLPNPFAPYERVVATNGQIVSIPSQTIGDTKLGEYLQKFASNGGARGTGRFDFAKARREGIKRIEDEFGGVVEGVANRSATLNPKEIRFMQSTVSNKTGDYTVLNNAKTFSESPSKIFELDPIRVWQDGKGNIWTLDHRRLAAARLAGIGKVPVQWVSKAEVYKDAWKFTTKVDGKSVVLKIGNGSTQIIK